MVEPVIGATNRDVRLGSRILGRNAWGHDCLNQIKPTSRTTVNAKKTTKCRNGHSAHETGTARTNPVVARTKWRAAAPYSEPP